MLRPWSFYITQLTLSVLKPLRQLSKGKPNVAVWDTAFGGTMEPKAYLYAIPREYYESTA